MTSYAERAKADLAVYKRNTLGITEDGLWSGNGRPYGHILPEGLKDLNLIEPYRHVILDYLKQRNIRLHHDFHHLNSSQALALNLFMPALTEAPASVVEALTGASSPPITWEFEAVPDAVEGTNFDLMIHLESRARVYVEVKYTETGFGIAKADDEHKKKVREIYRERLTGKVRPEVLEVDTFVQNYQLLRNLAYGEPGDGAVVFVVPSGNEPAWKHARTLLDKWLLPGAGTVRLLSVEDLLVKLVAIGLDVPASYRRHYQLFRQKYLGVAAE